ncbi:MAG: hypothetical protein WBO95_01175 [Candidatus Dechloromonas phosphoritropha]
MARKILPSLRDTLAGQLLKQGQRVAKTDRAIKMESGEKNEATAEVEERNPVVSLLPQRAYTRGYLTIAMNSKSFVASATRYL